MTRPTLRFSSAFGKFKKVFGKPSPQSEATASQLDKTERTIIIQAIDAAGLKPDLILALLAPEAGVRAATVAHRIEHARAVADLCVAAQLGDAAPRYVIHETHIEQVRHELEEAVADHGPELSTTLPQSRDEMGVRQRRARLDPKNVYAKR
ncbi:hypothetical protein RM530_05645 [Algiphilus sp. W345]|uniref:Uncharacterized protein n=1 Tax=Banduia mediterranea TaxID=3075609 RepID=A0ABU2WHV0_9GAMM|nr:hypothetical protein [Algiphilus sp. W345]MDT0496846.1 hypothetical protein [Algiphilus sp. W345]